MNKINLKKQKTDGPESEKEFKFNKTSYLASINKIKTSKNGYF
jgi:hypothetical protein